MHTASILLASVAAMSVTAMPQALLSKRGAETNATLFAYGTNSSGWPVVYGNSDGLLYITEDADPGSSTLTPITWDLPSITSEDWIVNGNFANGTSAGSLYILDDDLHSVGVANGSSASTDTATTTTSSAATSASAAPGSTTTGFALFATQLVYNNQSELEAQFWASPTDNDDVYAVVWVPSDETAQVDGSFPLVIKGVEE